MHNVGLCLAAFAVFALALENTVLAGVSLALALWLIS